MSTLLCLLVIWAHLLPSQPPADVRVGLVRADAVTALTPELPKFRSTHRKFLFLAISRDYLTLPGETSGLRLTDSRPVFAVTIPADIDIDSEDGVRLVRLKLKDGRREVSHGDSPDAKFDKNDVVAVTFTPQSSEPAPKVRAFRVTVTAPLAPGEYALVVERRFYSFTMAGEARASQGRDRLPNVPPSQAIGRYIATRSTATTHAGNGSISAAVTPPAM